MTEHRRKYVDELEGVTLPTRWRVIERFERGPDPTGSAFSVGYIVEKDGRRGFLKALDLYSAFEDPEDITVALEGMTAAYNYERDLLNRCRELRMDRVVLAIDSGWVVVDPIIPHSAVPYIVFELADGDLRKYINLSRQFDLRWALRSLHHVATGLHQLHREHIAHQDLKPSNVMMFAGGRTSKVGDLGRASQKSRAGQFDDLPMAGAKGYAPPELWYGAPDSEWAERRLACDAYHLGSLIAYLFTGLSMTLLWMGHLPLEQRPNEWDGTYAEILPFVRDAFDRAVRDVEAQIPEAVRAALGVMLRRLCDPDPKLRGHPRNRSMTHGNRYSLERFVTELDVLATRAESVMLSPVVPSGGVSSSLERHRTLSSR